MDRETLTQAAVIAATHFNNEAAKHFPPNYDVDGGSAIPDVAIEPLEEAIVWFIAEVVQLYIDAGSEREVTLENEKLREAIRDELNYWSQSTKEQYQHGTD